jgi:hypothetical protein
MAKKRTTKVGLFSNGAYVVAGRTYKGTLEGWVMFSEFPAYRVGQKVAFAEYQNTHDAEPAFKQINSLADHIKTI